MTLTQGYMKPNRGWGQHIKKSVKVWLLSVQILVKEKLNASSSWFFSNCR